MSNEKSILVKVKGYPSWPALVIPTEKIPKRLLGSKTTSPENHYCVKFYNDNDYIWLKKSKTMSLAKQYDLLDSAEKITALIDKEASKRKTNDKLIKAYQMVLEQVNGVFAVDEFLNAGEEKYIDESTNEQDLEQQQQQQQQQQQDNTKDNKNEKNESAPTIEKETGKTETDKKKKPVASKKRTIKQENEDQPVKKQDTKAKKQPAKKATAAVKQESSKEATPKPSKKAATPTATKKSSTKKAATPAAAAAAAEKKTPSKKTFKFESPLVTGTTIPIYELVNRGPQHLDILKITPSNCGVASLPNFAVLSEKKLDLQDAMQRLKNLLFGFFTEYIKLKKKDKDVETIMAEPEFVEKSNAILAEFENLANNKSVNYFKYLFLQDQEFYHYFSTYLNVWKSTKSSDNSAERSEMKTLFEKFYVK